MRSGCRSSLGPRARRWRRRGGSRSAAPLARLVGSHEGGAIAGAGPPPMRQLWGAGALREGHRRVGREVARKVWGRPVRLLHGAAGAHRSPPVYAHMLQSAG